MSGFWLGVRERESSGLWDRVGAVSVIEQIVVRACHFLILEGYLDSAGVRVHPSTHTSHIAGPNIDYH